MTEETYRIRASRIKELAGPGGEYLMEELTHHRGQSSAERMANGPLKKVRWPETFYVQIDLETDDDTNGLQYFASPDNIDPPFLKMGDSDTLYWAIVALFRAIGERLD